MRIIASENHLWEQSVLSGDLMTPCEGFCVRGYDKHSVLIGTGKVPIGKARAPTAAAPHSTLSETKR